MIASPAPWSGEISDAPVRIAWVLFCLIAMPTLLRMCGIPSEMLSLFSVAAALPGCVAPLPVLGIKKAESKDFILIAGLYALIIILSAVINLFWLPLLNNLGISYCDTQEIVRLLQNAKFSGRIMIFLSGCLLTPVVEEVLFRRMIYAQWQKIHAPTAFSGTTVLFAVLHFFISGLPGLLIMGGCFQYIFLKRQNLLSAIMLHALVNTIAFTMSLLFIQEI